MGNQKSLLRKSRDRKSCKSRKSCQYVNSPSLPNSPNSQNSPNSPIETESPEPKYYLPTNDDDIDRQHMHHFIRRYEFQSNFSAPIEDGLIRGGFKVLDVGCGAGTWLLDLATRYKNSWFIGLDIAPIFPSQVKPGNLNFVKADIFDGLPFPDNEFDFVRTETMLYILTPDQWNDMISEMIRVTKPGGYIEISESYSIYETMGPIFYKINQAFAEAALQRGVDVKFVSYLDEMLESYQNVTNINRDERSIIIGPNGGKTGTVFQDLYLSFCSNDSAIEVICSCLNISYDKCKDLVKYDLIEELKQTRFEARLVRYSAQKINY